MRKVRIGGGAAAVALAGFGLTLWPAFAQQTGSSPRMTFGIDQVFDVDDNLDLDVPSDGTSVQSTTGLSFGLLSDTGISSLALDVATGLRILNGPNNGPGTNTTIFDLNNTRIALDYDRAVANSSLSVGALYTMDQIDTVLTLGDFPTGAVVPEDLSQLNGTGQRRFYALNAALNYGLQDPVGYQLTAGFSGLDYANATDPSLFGNTRAYAGASLVLALSPVDQGTIGLTWGAFNSDDPANNPSSNNLNLDIGVTRTLTNGTVGISVFADGYTDDTDSRAGLSLTRALNLPTGSLAASIGTIQLENQDPELTGSLAWQQNLPDGNIALGATRTVQNDSANVPQYVTGLRFGYDYQLGALSQLAFDVGYSLTEDTTSPSNTQTGSFSAVYSRALTPDWALDVGYTYRQRDEDNTGMARSNSVFLGLRRAWDVSP